MGFCFESVVQPKVGEIEWRDDQLTMAFKTFDTDNDRKLSKRELKEAFKYLGSHCSRFRVDRRTLAILLRQCTKPSNPSATPSRSVLSSLSSLSLARFLSPLPFLSLSFPLSRSTSFFSNGGDSPFVLPHHLLLR
ncbi:hypothetical protein F8388_013314 [Cannabis sativa]|uniref:EF-hand domain-containing protein n=1 Tax=Cannabis sativa TaxID=3483 RepID=A0A7J6HAS8_CANSA|nr:hypothetical protein F8388_009661 [Cannabis sativa]KAF4356449.1 hypothetical protein F8388_013314 [Cannabis sativa]KAF4392342.1 hypothetical protein G4B88_005301 [Cannabis sativa]